MIIAFCGHSSYIANVEDEAQLSLLLEKVAHGQQVDFYLGGYGGFDSFALSCAQKYKKAHQDAKLIYITPYLDRCWRARETILYTMYDEILYPPLESVPQRFSILKRNEWIVNQADDLFGYVQAHSGGAYKMLLYAHKRKKPYINLYQGNFQLY